MTKMRLTPFSTSSLVRNIARADQIFYVPEPLVHGEPGGAIARATVGYVLGYAALAMGLQGTEFVRGAIRSLRRAEEISIGGQVAAGRTIWPDPA